MKAIKTDLTIAIGVAVFFVVFMKQMTGLYGNLILSLGLVLGLSVALLRELGRVKDSQN